MCAPLDKEGLGRFAVILSDIGESYGVKSSALRADPFKKKLNLFLFMKENTALAEGIFTFRTIILSVAKNLKYHTHFSQ